MERDVDFPIDRTELSIEIESKSVDVDVVVTSSSPSSPVSERISSVLSVLGSLNYQAFITNLSHVVFVCVPPLSQCMRTVDLTPSNAPSLARMHRNIHDSR